MNADEQFSGLTKFIGDYVFLIILLSMVPLVALAWWKRIYPYRRLVMVLCLGALLSVGFAIPEQVQAATFGALTADRLLIGVCIYDAVVLLLAVADLLTLPFQHSFSAERKVMRIASLQQNHHVTLRINNLSPWSHEVWIRDDLPQEFTATPAEFAYHLEPRTRATSHYEFKSKRRGAFHLRCIYIRARSKLGLWQRFLAYDCASSVHVYPDMKQLSEYALLARTNRLSLMGVRRTRKIGQDNEFERLRDYTLDDNYKHIEWRATARRNKLTVKDFQTNQSQRIVFLIDCGRMMTNQSAGLSLLDHSLNAMLMLSYVALSKGDSVGMIGFSNDVHTYIPPRGGLNQMNHLLHASFDRFPQLVESRYDEAFLYLATYCKKRSLVVLISNLIDEVNAHQVEQYLANLVGRHLPLGVMLRDHELFDEADRVNPQGSLLYSSAAAATILSWRHQVLTDLHHKGVRALDVFPEEMTVPLINTYLEIKARHLL